MNSNDVIRLCEIALRIKETEPMAARDILLAAFIYEPTNAVILKNLDSLGLTLNNQQDSNDVINCAFIPAEAFALLMTAQLRKYKKPFVLITPDHIDVSSITSRVVQNSSGVLIKISDVATTLMSSIRHIWLHSFALVDKSYELVKKYNLDYSIYSDAFKNEISPAELKGRLSSYESVLTFGFLWYKEYLNHKAKLVVCKFKDVIKVFDEVKELADIEQNLTADDYEKDWIFLRYWGQGTYTFKKKYNYIPVIKKYLEEKKLDSVLIKGDSRIDSALTGKLVDMLGENINAEKLEDKFAFNSSCIRRKDAFFAEAMIPSGFKGNVHAFDSSLTVYLALTTNAIIHFPSKELLCEVFHDPVFSSNIYNYTRFYSAVCDHIKKHKDTSSPDLFFIVNNINGEYVTSQQFDDQLNTIDFYMAQAAFERDNK